MARRTVSFIVAVTVDEDAMRLREDDEPTAWAGVLGTLATALETIAHDNLGDDLAAEVNVGTGHTGIEYAPAGMVWVAGHWRDVRRAADGRTDNEQVD